jgi:hypothetical protein
MTNPLSIANPILRIYMGEAILSNLSYFGTSGAGRNEWTAAALLLVELF